MTKQSQGALLMLASAFLFSAHLLILKHASLSLHPFQIAFLRNTMASVVLGGMLLWVGPSMIRNGRTFALRCVLGTGAGLALYYANANAPLAAVTLIFHARIFLLLALASLVLKEQISPPRWLAIIMGFTGIIIVIMPDRTGGWSMGLLAATAAAALSSGSQIAVKALTRDNAPLTIAAFSQLAITALSAPMAIPVWLAPPLPAMALIGTAAAFSAMAALAAAKAFSLTQASVVSPMDNTGIVLSAALGFVFFGEVPGPGIVIGAILVLGGAFYVAQKT
ncbi:DMT family transporter [Magnetospirillum gryphiswaldense]|nr:DMT family transporter [Magnetospirillum gryphiswaldense]